jgi:hypothetical protein
MSAEKMTLVERLRNPQWVTSDSGLDGHVPHLDQAVTLAVMKEAADKIEHLQSVAGAVSQGESFSDIRAAAEGKS